MTAETRIQVNPPTSFANDGRYPERPEIVDVNDPSQATNNSVTPNKPVQSGFHQPNSNGRPVLPVYAPRRSKNFVARKCDPCIRVFKWFPVLFITAVLSWGYYAYVLQLCLFTIESVILKILYILIFHILYIMTLWSYYQTIMTDVGRVPREFWFTVTDVERLNAELTEEARKAVCESIVRERNLPILCRTYSGGFRICEKCNLLKPDRAHHCSVCETCVLKMDHHCPWVNNCVSFTNYKFFVLFLGYAFTLCAWSAVTSFGYFLRFWKNDLPQNDGKLHILFLFFVSIMFAVSLVSLYLYHLFLVFKNRSTLESFRTPIFRYGPDRKAYDLGRKRNWRQVFGDTRLAWFLPLSSCRGSGFVFETRVNKLIGGQSPDLPSDDEDFGYPDGRLPLLATDGDSSDQDELFNKVEITTKSIGGDETPKDEKCNSEHSKDGDDMVTVDLSDDDTDFTEIITRNKVKDVQNGNVSLLMDS